MKRTLAKALVVIAEAGIDLLAERIKKRRKRNGNHRRLDHLRHGGDAYGVRHQSAGHSSAVDDRRTMRKRNMRRRSISKG